MCGIAGFLSLNGSHELSRETLMNMTAALRHRGPDEFGVYIDDSVGLGHARLSIIDLAGGSQPIHNQDKSLWIVFNGEIFNYLELRDDLKKKGHRFYTSSDTEVIIHAYEEEGPACVNRFNGQFAFAIWDARKKELFLARDRMGIRPLHYAIHDNTLFFASEIKSIFAADAVPREIDPMAVDQVFTFWAALPGTTPFKGVKELRPAHHLMVKDGKLKAECYWNLPFWPVGEQADWSVNEIKERINDLITDAIRVRLRSDVPVGCYLSGGLDSSAIATRVVRDFDSDVNTFGIRFESGAFDEGEYQQEMVEFLKVSHRETWASNSKISEAFPEAIWHCEKPLLRTAPVPLYLLSRLVHENGFKVVLTGEGADEIFGGYNIFREAKVRAFMTRQPDSAVRPLLLRRLYPYIFSNPRSQRVMQSFFSRGLDQADSPFFSHLIRWENTSRIKAFFSPEMLATVGGHSPYDELEKLLPGGFDDWGTVPKAQYLESIVFLSNYLLSSQGDRMAMANSLEIRMPYLDYRVIEFMGGVPASLKIAGLREKQILKRCFEGVIPEGIRNRPKHPYRAPIKDVLLGGGNADAMLELVSDSALEKTGLFDVNKVGKFITRQKATNSTSEVDGMALCGILSTQILHNQYVESFDRDCFPPITPTVSIDRRSTPSASR